MTARTHKTAVAVAVAGLALVVISLGCVIAIIAPTPSLKAVGVFLAVAGVIIHLLAWKWAADS